MESLRFFGISICVTAVITAMFSMLAPKRSLDRGMRFVLSLFFLVGLLTPFFDSSLSFPAIAAWEEREAAANERLQYQIEEQFASLVEKNLAAATERALLEYGIAPEKVSVHIHIAADGSVSITTVDLVLASEESRAAEAQSIVKRLLGETTEIQMRRKGNET